MPSDEGAPGCVASDVCNILIVGGSYAGIAATVSLLDICAGKKCRFAGGTEKDHIPIPRVSVQITIVDERDGYYHLIGSPLAFADQKYASKAWKKFEDIPALRSSSVRYIQGSVTAIDCERKIAVINTNDRMKSIEHMYDYIIVCSGLRRKPPTVPASLNRTDYLAETQRHIDLARAAEGVVVIGGGAVGIEMAAELKLVDPAQEVTLIHSRTQLLSNESLPDDFKDQALSILQEMGVQTVLGQRVTSTETTNIDNKPRYTLTLQNGNILQAGLVINAVSKFTPTSTFLPSSATDNEGYIRIQPNLSFQPTVPNSSYHYAAGDIALWSGIKRAGAAIHQGTLAAQNLHQHILQTRFDIPASYQLLEHVPPMMGLAVGKKAVTYGPDEGVKSGEDMMKLYFGDDLAFDGCYNHMKLGEEAEDVTVR